MSTAVAIPPLPAHLVKFVEQYADENSGAAGGIKAGSWPRISIGGSKFSIKENGESTLICDPTNPDLPKMQLELVCVGHNPMVSKTYYEGDWAEGDADEPNCSSDDGMRPDDHVITKQSASCATCKWNVWGSKVTPQGKQVKACSDSKRLVFLRGDDLEGPAYELSVKPGSLKDWATYVRDLDSRKLPVSAVKTLVYFDPAATYPKLLFKFGGYLTEQELAIVSERKQGDDVKLIASPRRTGPQPTGTSAPIAPPAAAPAPAPAPAAPVVDPYAGQQSYVKASVEAAGGFGSDAGRTVYKTLTGKDYVSQAPAPATPPPAPVEPPKPVDPYEGLAAHVKAAVEASGGLTSAAGQAVYRTLAGKDAPGVNSQPATAPAAKRGRKATAPAAPPAPVATPAAAETPPAAAQPAEFSQAPAAQTAQSGGPVDIEALLTQALATPTGK